MAKKLSEFLKNLIVKAGGNPEDDALKGAMSAINADLELADELTTAIDNGLLSIATAKNNYPELKNHYFAQAYKGLDNELNNYIESEKLPEEIINELKQETSSTKRAVLLSKKIKELEGKKANAGKGDTEKLNTQITDLNNQLRLEKEAKSELEKKHNGDIKNVKKKFFLNQLLTGYKTIHDTLDPETKNIILSAVIQKHLNSKDADWDINEKDEFVLSGKGGTNIFSKDNNLLTPKTFIEQVLADEKMLVVTDNNGNNNNNNNSNRPNGQHSNNGQNWQQNNNNGNQNNNNGGRKHNAVFQELIERSQNDLQNSANGGTRIM